MYELRMIYTRGPDDADEEIHFTDADSVDPAKDWAKPGWEVMFDTVIQSASADTFPGGFPSENSFAKTL